MADSVGEWVTLVHAAYPPREAAEWDHVGLQVGDEAWPVERVLVTLDVTRAVVAEAAQVPATLVLAHHPLLFRPLRALTPATTPGRIALDAARVGVAVLAAHTNLDVARDGAGTSDPVASLLGLVDLRPLTTELRGSETTKLVTFVPPEAVDAVLDAVTAAGAGRIGEYERCSFRVAGTGTFRPLPTANPYSGGGVEVDAAEPEYRMEFETPRARVGAVVRALMEAHPYDEVAYDLLPLLAGAEVGFGRIGRLPEPRSLRTLADLVRSDLPAPHLRFAGDPERGVRTVAVVGGAGEALIGAALEQQADVLVTGDLKHHVALDALDRGLALVDAGHHATEAAAMPAWSERLRNEAQRRGLSASVIASATPSVPWS